MAKRGRKGAFGVSIKPRYSEIKSWLENGATERQVAENLGIAYSTFNKYKADNSEFAEFIKNGRRSLVAELRGALVKKALGFTYTEKKIYKKRDENGLMTEYVEETTKIAHPDVAALNLCLKNYDADNWANDPQMMKFKEKELKLRKEIAERDDF